MDGRSRMGKTISKSGNETQIPIRSVSQSIQAIEPRVDVHVEGGLRVDEPNCNSKPTPASLFLPFEFGGPFHKLDPKTNYCVPLGMLYAPYWLLRIWLHSYSACVRTWTCSMHATCSCMFSVIQLARRGCPSIFPCFYLAHARLFPPCVRKDAWRG